MKNPKRSNQLEIAFKPAKKPQRSLPVSEESPEEIVISGEEKEEEFLDNVPDSIFIEVSDMLDDSEVHVNVT